MTPYDDIIDHPHHVSAEHPPMSMHDRAAQFSPFAALVGYEEAVSETARLTETRRELDEQEKAELNRKLIRLCRPAAEHPEITVEYYVPDDRKAGGRCVELTGIVEVVSKEKRTITMRDGTVIAFQDILSIQSE